jgi:hypothetical protein
MRRRDVLPLVFDVEALELLVRVGDALDGHAPPDLAPAVESGEPLRLDHPPPAEALVPADRLEDERRENVEEVLVGDLEPPVDLVHPPQRPTSRLAAVAVLEDRADDQVCVVVAFLGRAGELAGRVEQPGDAGDRKGSEERELEGACRIPWELVAHVEVDDPLVVADRVERQDLSEIRASQRSR